MDILEETIRKQQEIIGQNPYVQGMSENVQAARSSIQDADYAVETSKFYRDIVNNGLHI